MKRNYSIFDDALAMSAICVTGITLIVIIILFAVVGITDINEEAPDLPKRYAEGTTLILNKYSIDIIDVSDGVQCAAIYNKGSNLAIDCWNINN